MEDGDTLFEIARHELGKTSRWAEIYDLNREVLGNDFDYLRPGLELILPDEKQRAKTSRGSRRACTRGRLIPATEANLPVAACRETDPAPRRIVACAGRCDRRRRSREIAFGSLAAANSLRPNLSGTIVSASPWICSSGP